MSELSIATFGGGCFWCTEGAFQQLQGVHSVQSGYAGGHTENPTYEAVCTGNTGHAEVVQIQYDASVISYRELLEVLFAIHDPTQLNRQGNDIGTQYRSAIFYHTEAQREVAEAFIAEVTADEVFDQPIVTEISPLQNWYPAEDHHEDYFNRNPEQPYCAAVVAPKLARFRKTFADKLKK
ncbi:peptide-methionine (S)-S-oxide reductase [Aliidiomarina taiwanensis]|uniref:Peptide methionine sulfoxide reductase MsrA n=1 Tax=Aliidiomarina taiwanensis TaxID=946228 RepID=A0A432X807_9GAMM|nr:peptide-methionine (S)-S-oxide reductase MsrA [Aliidiomarina taiwanensis]RUO42972.1 peptide-methionine (S)-S-oxide reductase [Aliidiomarina taiwanensis]